MLHLRPRAHFREPSRRFRLCTGMKPLLAILTCGLLLLPLASRSALALDETPLARSAAEEAVDLARQDLAETFGEKPPANGEFFWREDAARRKVDRVVISLSGQLAFAYDGHELIAVSSISSGRQGHETPTGVFAVLDKQRTYYSRKYDNAPMPFMQRIDRFGTALHAGALPGHPASHGCVRLPRDFASRLFSATNLGTEVLIGN
jgi:hypothetical protein